MEKLLMSFLAMEALERIQESPLLKVRRGNWGRLKFVGGDLTRWLWVYRV